MLLIAIIIDKGHFFTKKQRSRFDRCYDVLLHFEVHIWSFARMADKGQKCPDRTRYFTDSVKSNVTGIFGILGQNYNWNEFV